MRIIGEDVFASALGRVTLACGMGLKSNLQNTMPSTRKSSAYFALPVTLPRRSGGVKSFPSNLYAMSRSLCRTHYRVQVVVIGAATAEIAG
jgi:hypothetical protein